MLVFQGFPYLITLGGVVIMLMGEQFLHMTGLGWGNPWESCRPTSPGLHAFFN